MSLYRTGSLLRPKRHRLASRHMAFAAAASTALAAAAAALCVMMVLVAATHGGALSTSPPLTLLSSARRRPSTLPFPGQPSARRERGRLRRWWRGCRVCWGRRRKCGRTAIFISGTGTHGGGCQHPLRGETRTASCSVATKHERAAAHTEKRRVPQVSRHATLGVVPWCSRPAARRTLSADCRSGRRRRQQAVRLWGPSALRHRRSRLPRVQSPLAPRCRPQMCPTRKSDSP